MPHHTLNSIFPGRAVGILALAILPLVTACGAGYGNAQGGYPGNAASVPAGQGGGAAGTDVAQTRWGPLSAADRELLVKVRLASLWEMPSAQQATQRGSSARVRRISAEIAAQHADLDRQVRSAAAKLDVRLPVQATAQQQGWMSEISGETGADYDATYVRILRFAHGQVFSLIGAVRGSTRNTLVRTFAEAANTAVLNHMRLLESTRLTDDASFPEPPAAAPKPVSAPT